MVKENKSKKFMEGKIWVKFGMRIIRKFFCLIKIKSRILHAGNMRCGNCQSWVDPWRTGRSQTRLVVSEKSPRAFENFDTDGFYVQCEISALKWMIHSSLPAWISAAFHFKEKSKKFKENHSWYFERFPFFLVKKTKSQQNECWINMPIE